MNAPAPIAHDMRAEILALGSELLDPKRGVMRGIYSDDSDSQLLRMNIGEARKISRFVATACHLLSEEQS